jgi:hypothetical protein
MKRAFKSELTDEERARHRRIRAEVEAEKPEMIARDRLRLQLRELAEKSRTMLEAAERGDPPSAEMVRSFREAIERAEAVS